MRVRGLLLLALAPTAVAAQEGGFNAECDLDQRLFISGSIVGNGQGLCYVHDPASSASFSFSADHQANETSGTVDLTVAYRAFPIRNFDDASYSGFVYAEAEGQFDASDGPNELRFGAYFEGFWIQPPSGNADLFLSYGLGAYVLTDFETEARGYGITGSLVPIVNSEPLGVNYIGEDFNPYVISRFDLDAVWVDEGGNTGYQDGTEYAFAEAVLGLGFGQADRFDASVVYVLGADVMSGTGYDGVTARLNVPLSEAAQMSFVYARSEDRVTSAVSETSNITLGFQF